MSSAFVVDPPVTLLPPDYGTLCYTLLTTAVNPVSINSTEVVPRLEEQSNESNLKVIDLDKSVTGLTTGTENTTVETPASISAVDLSRLTVKDLRELCRKKGIKTTGKRDELIKMLQQVW